MNNFMKKPVSSLFATSKVTAINADVAIGTLRAVQQSQGETSSKTDFLARDDRDMFRTDVTDYRYAKTADELLTLLSKFDPDVSTGIWNFLRLSNSGLIITGLGPDLRPNAEVQSKLDDILFRFSGMNNFKDWALVKPIGSIANSIIKYVLLRGGSGLELVLDRNKKAKNFKVVDPISIHFKHTGPGVFKPYQTNQDGVEVDLGIPTFFWQVLDADADSPYETPPFLPVIQAILFNISVMQDLERIVKRVAYPRLSVTVIEETLRKFAPADIQTDDEKLTNWLAKQKNDIGTGLSELAPEDAAVFFDSMKIDILEAKGNATIDFRPLKEIIDQRIISGLKSLPTILGRAFGSSQTIGGVEALLYAKSIVSLQEVAADLLARALTLAVRLEGIEGFTAVKYKPVSLRPEAELESFKSLEQARVLEQLSLGLITDEEATVKLTGSPYLPEGYMRLSGTGFYKERDLSAARAIEATRNPTAAEQAGGGRNT